MAQRICIASQKGGVGKTTVSLNLAVALAQRGRRVLLADLDPQGGIGHSLARSDAELAGLSDLLVGRVQAERALVRTKLEGLTLLPRGHLDPVDACEYEDALRRPGVLAAVLEKVESDSDVVLFDTPAGVGGITRAALAVSHFILVPFQTEMLDLRSVTQILRVVEHVRQAENPRLQLLGILPTMVEKSRPTAVAVLAETWKTLAGVLETTIPRVEAFADASARGIPVAFLPGPVSPEGRRFDMLAAELELLMERLGSPEARHEEDRPQRDLL